MLHRRRFLLSAAAASLVPAGLVWCGYAHGAEPTPACGEATPRQTEGPFFKPEAPFKRDLREAGMAGEALRLEGAVLDRACAGIPGAKVEIWQADSLGHYDNQGFRLRGHVMANADGQWRIDTILPADYSGRTRHVHVKVYAAPRARPLTTQLYFPGEAGNERDRLFTPRLLVAMQQTPAGKLGRYNFVIST